MNDGYAAETSICRVDPGDPHGNRAEATPPVARHTGKLATPIYLEIRAEDER